MSSKTVEQKDDNSKLTYEQLDALYQRKREAAFFWENEYEMLCKELREKGVLLPEIPDTYKLAAKEEAQPEQVVVADKKRRQVAEKIVEYNFKGLGEFITDEDILHWYKQLIVTCMLDWEKGEAVG